jgi:hypothetical protein
MNSSSHPMTVTRRLGIGEHAFWLMNQFTPFHFAICAQIEGPTTVEGWRAALDMVQRRHPLFSVNIRLNKDGHPHFQHFAETRIPLRVIASDDLRWEPEMERELLTPVNAEHSPLVRAVLLHQAHRAVIILSSHHSIADTKSLIFAIRDALQALSGKLLDALPPIGSFDTLLLSVAGETDDDMPNQAPAPEPTGKPIVYREPDGSAPRISSLSLAPDLTRELRRRSRAEETTVHGALVAAAVEAARQISGELREAVIRVCSAIDARKLIEAGEDVALLAGGKTILMEPQITDFWEMARLAKRKIAPWQTLESFSRMIGGGKQFMADLLEPKDVAAFMAQHGFELNISNLGEIPIETRFGDLTLTSLWGPSILQGFQGEQEIGVATVNGSLNMLHASYDPLPLLLETMQKILTAACS